MAGLSASGLKTQIRSYTETDSNVLSDSVLENIILNAQYRIFRDGARVSTDYAVANFFHFTVDTDTATIGGVKGGGVGCSVGPVTLSS